jgi:hypothetical protein
VDIKGAKSIKIKTSVVSACCADGTDLPLLLIFKRKIMISDNNQQGICIQNHAKRWMDESGMILWLKKLWSKHPGGPLKKPGLLACDQFRSHMMQATKRTVTELNTIGCDSQKHYSSNASTRHLN